MKLLAMLLHPSVYSHTYSMVKFSIYFEGDPESVPPFEPNRLFWKFGALAFPNLRSEKSEKKIRGRRLYVGLTVLSFIAVYQSVPCSPNIWQIHQKKCGGGRVPQPPFRKTLKKYWVWESIICWSSPSFIDLLWTLTEIFHFQLFGNSPVFQNR